MPSMKRIPSLYKLVFSAEPPDMRGQLDQLVALADKARREGLLALDAMLGEIEDPFTRSALQLVVDGTDPEMVARDPRGRGRRHGRAPRGLRRAVREGRRLRADDGHHRHRARPRARAAEPRRAGRARAVHLRRVHRHADGRRLRQRDLPADRQPPEGDLRRRDGAADDDARGDPLDPGGRQPAAGRRKADVLPAAHRAAATTTRTTSRASTSRPGRPDDGPRRRSPPARGRRGGQQRALAADLRRHDHAADGAVHGPVLDLLRQHLQVRNAAEVVEGGVLRGDPARRQSDRPPGRHRQRRAGSLQRRTAGDRARRHAGREQPGERQRAQLLELLQRRRQRLAGGAGAEGSRRVRRTSSRSSTPTPRRTASPRACRPRSKRAAW